MVTDTIAKQKAEQDSLSSKTVQHEPPAAQHNLLIGSGRRQFQPYSIREIQRFPPPRWRVDRLLPVGAFGMLYSAEGEGKTFFALDLALSVATGIPFHGRKVTQGPVIYVLGEGRGGLRNRINAWLKEHDLQDVPEAFIVLEAVQFRNRGDVAAFEREIKELNVKPAMVFIDTFARCAVGVDENDAKDMGEWIESVRAFQLANDVDVLVLHHSTKGDGRERGSSAFVAAVDTTMRLSNSFGIVTVSCEKQKDAEPFKQFHLQLKVVQLKPDESGESAESCVLEPCDGSGSSGVDTSLLKVLFELGGTAKRKEWIERSGLSETTFDRRRRELSEAGLIESDGVGVFRLTETGSRHVSTSSSDDVDRAA